MIGVLTLNPCVDQTLFVNEFSSPGEMEIQNSLYLAGGKGNNVARVLQGLGVSVLSMVLVAGTSGQMIRALLENEGLSCAFFELEGHSRYITTVVDRNWKQTVFREKTVISAPSISAVRRWITNFLPQMDMLCICGSVPSPQFDSLPSDLIGEANQRGIPVLLDTTGNALRQGLLAKPTYCKPNQEEAATLFQESNTQLVWAMYQKGIRHPIISMGAGGALSVDNGKLIHIEAPKIDAVNPVGSGDSFIAGLVYALKACLPWQECLTWATACGAANAAKWEVANVTQEEIEILRKKVFIHTM